MLYRIDDSPSYILGSLHLLPHGFPVPSKWADAYRKTKQLVLESDLDKKPTISGLHEPPNSLRDEVSPEFIDSLRPACERLSLTLDELLLMKLWAVAITIGTAIHTVQGRKPPGIDRIFFRRARAASRPVIPLEEPDASLQAFSGLSSNFLLRAIKEVVDDIPKELRKQQELYGAWVAEDVGRLVSASEMNRDPEFWAIAHKKRNRDWLPKLVEVARSKTSSLVVVGVTHLLGEGSLIELLANEGIRVTPLPKK